MPITNKIIDTINKSEFKYCNITETIPRIILNVP